MRDSKFPLEAGEAKPCTERRGGSCGGECRKNSNTRPSYGQKESLLEKGQHFTECGLSEAESGRA